MRFSNFGRKNANLGFWLENVTLQFWREKRFSVLSGKCGFTIFVKLQIYGFGKKHGYGGKCDDFLVMARNATIFGLWREMRRFSGYVIFWFLAKYALYRFLWENVNCFSRKYDITGGEEKRDFAILAWKHYLGEKIITEL